MHVESIFRVSYQCGSTLVVLTRIIVDAFPIYANVKQLTQSMKLGPIIAPREHFDQTCLQLVCVRSIILLTCWFVLLSL